jgi:hypothetical protein
VQVDAPQSVKPFVHFTALLGSVTDTLNCYWDCTYTESPVTVENLDVNKLRTTAQEVTGLYGGGGISLARTLFGILTQIGHV